MNYIPIGKVLFKTNGDKVLNNISNNDLNEVSNTIVALIENNIDTIIYNNDNKLKLNITNIFEKDNTFIVGNIYIITNGEEDRDVNKYKIENAMNEALKDIINKLNELFIKSKNSFISNLFIINYELNIDISVLVLASLLGKD